MAKWQLKNLRSLNLAAHRDFGYFFSVLIIVYCLSGLALNHVNEWNPDFIITRDSVAAPGFTKEGLSKPGALNELGKLVGEKDYKVYDFPTPSQVKVYYDDASLHVDLNTGIGIYEKVSRRPLFYHVNALHRNSLKQWRWVADVFAIMLIVLNITGIFIVRGKYGISGRGKWLIAAGTLPPVAAIVIFMLQ